MHLSSNFLLPALTVAGGFIISGLAEEQCRYVSYISCILYIF